MDLGVRRIHEAEHALPAALPDVMEPVWEVFGAEPAVLGAVAERGAIVELPCPQREDRAGQRDLQPALATLAQEGGGVVPVFMGMGPGLHRPHRLEVGALELAVAHDRFHVHLDRVEARPCNRIQQSANCLGGRVTVP